MANTRKMKLSILVLVVVALSLLVVGIANIGLSRVSASEPVNFSMKDGASVKIMENKDDSGIRFRFYLDASTFEGITESGAYVENKEIAAIIAPKFIADVTELTYENAKAVDSQLEYLLLPAERWCKDSEDDTKYTTYAYVYGIPEKMYSKQMCARGVIVDKTSGSAVTEYTDTITRSIAYTAKDAVLNGNELTSEDLDILGNYYNDRKVTFETSFPTWYKDAEKSIKVTATNKANAAESFEFDQVVEDNGYSITLIDGNYDIKVSTPRFVAKNVNDFAVDGDKALLANAIEFTTPKVANETIISSYNETGFVLPSGKFVKLADVSATEGFVAKYNISTTIASGDTAWYTGGFGFEMDGTIYSIAVYTRKNTAGTIRIGLFDQSNDALKNDPCFLSTPISLTSAQVKNIEVTIAYYDGSFYVQVFDNIAFKICLELLEQARPASDNWPVFFANNTLANANDNSNIGKRTKFFGTDASKLFNAGTHAIGFRAAQGTSTFTNVQYELGNTTALNAVKAMRVVAEDMAYDIPSETPWTTLSDLPAYEWSTTAQDKATNGIKFLNNGTDVLNLSTIFADDSAANFTATYTVDSVTTSVTDFANFMPTESGILTLKPHVSGSAKTLLTIAVTVETNAAKTISFSVQYPDWYKETDYNDTITVTATNKVSAASETLTATKVAGNDYTFELLDGNYDISVASSRFVAKNVNDFTVDSDKALSASTISFTTPKLNSSTVTYNDTGFVRGASTFTKLANVSAEEGFIIRYTVDVTNSETTWFAGGFGFEMGGKTYGIGVYTRKDQAGTIRIGLHDSSTWRTDNTNGPAFLTTSLSVTADELTHLDVEIAYYQGNYYVKVENKFAFRICPELFASQVTNNNYPIYFGDNTDNGNTNKRAFFSAAGHSTEGKSKIFDAGTRSLGFKTYQGTSKFTNVQYELGNEAAIKAIYGTAAENYQGGMYGVMKAMRNSSNAEFNYISGTEWPLKN